MVIIIIACRNKMYFITRRMDDFQEAHTLVEGVYSKYNYIYLLFNFDYEINDCFGF